MTLALRAVLVAAIAIAAQGCGGCRFRGSTQILSVSPEGNCLTVTPAPVCNEPRLTITNGCAEALVIDFDARTPQTVQPGETQTVSGPFSDPARRVLLSTFVGALGSKTVTFVTAVPPL